jgi:hypothetical protein
MVFARVRGRAAFAASPAHVSVAWPFRLAHRVIRRHRRPLRGLRGGARIGFLSKSDEPPLPLRHLRRTGRGLPEGRSSPVLMVFRPSFGAWFASLPLLVLPSFFWAPLPGVSGSVRFPPKRLRTPDSASRCQPLCSFRPRGLSTSTVCSAAGLRHVAVGAGSGVRVVGSRSSVGAPPALLRRLSVRRGSGLDGPTRVSLRRF